MMFTTRGNVTDTLFAQSKNFYENNKYGIIRMIRSGKELTGKLHGSMNRIVNTCIPLRKESRIKNLPFSVRCIIALRVPIITKAVCSDLVIC